MDLERYTDEELLRSIEAEIAKSTAELRCLQTDADKISGRLRFCIAVLHIIKNRDKKVER
jgi:hypothetical protein